MKDTKYQTLARVAELTGQKLHLKPWEELVGVKVEENRVTVSLVTHQVTELVREVRLTGRGRRLISWSWSESGQMSREEFTIWDENFVPEVHKNFPGRTQQEERQRALWEKDCYRPGNGGRFGQRDSFDRAVQAIFDNDQAYTTATKPVWKD